MVILGIDPGLATLGWGVIDAQPGRQRLIEYGCILTTPDQRFPERLKQIGEDMRALLQRFQPEEIAFVLSRPRHLVINEVLLRPADQQG